VIRIFLRKLFPSFGLIIVSQRDINEVAAKYGREFITFSE